MPTTRHTLTAAIPVFFTFPGLAEGERERANTKIEVTYSFQFAEPSPELVLIDAKLLEGDGLDLSDADVRDRAQCWLDDEGYDAACEHAAGERVA